MDKERTREHPGAAGTQGPKAPLSAVAVLMFFSGAAALAYQVVWFRP